MEICCWKTNVPLVSVPTSILLVHLKDTMWPIEGKLANTGISKAVFYNGLAEIGSSPFFTSPKVRGWRHFAAGVALESHACFGLQGYGAKTYPGLLADGWVTLLVIEALVCGRVAHWLYFICVFNLDVLHLVLYYTNIAKVMTTSIKFWKHGPNSHKTNFTKLCQWTENRGKRN